MAARRGHNEGSIYRKRNRWMAAVSYIDAAGEPQRIVKICATRRDAQEMLVTLLAQRQQGVDLTPSDLTVREFVTDMLTKHFNRDEATRENYLRMMRLRVFPRIGGLAMEKLTPKALADLYHQLQPRRGRRDRGSDLPGRFPGVLCNWSTPSYTSSSRRPCAGG